MATESMRVPLYTRLDRRTHRLLAAYARASDSSLNDIVECLVMQLLFQVSAEFEPPRWLLEATESGAIPIQRCSHLVAADVGEDDEPHFDNLIHLGR